MRILLCFGTRPEAIKMAPLFHAFKKTNVKVSVCVTAQHREMLDQVLDFFEINPDYDLDIMQHGQSLNQLSSSIIKSLDVVLDEFLPDYVLVHGDTTTSSIAALAAFHKGIKVGHVEAGLRTLNKQSPFPEEMNRQVTARIADWHFAPTSCASENLIRENIPRQGIVVTGNTVIDALYLGLSKIENGYSSRDLDFVKSLADTTKKIILVTGHRRENFGAGFESLCHAVSEIAKNDNVQIIYPVHLNPNVQEPVYRILNNIKNVHLIDPIDYPAFIWLMKQSYLILTDSGGIQEEAPALGKPVILMRENTERPEAVEAGVVVLTGTDADRIINVCNELLANNKSYLKMSEANSPYGNGDASGRIVDCLYTVKNNYENSCSS